MDDVTELLTFIPPWPHVVPFDKVAKDLNTSVRKLTTLVRAARTRGFDVQLRAKGENQYRYLMATQYGWCKIEDAALQYWRDVYEVTQ